MTTIRNYSKIVLPLVEKFYSVQGEGFNAGHAAFFVRYAGCNLNCVFADGSVCDTPWQKAQEKISIHDLCTWIRETDTATFERAANSGLVVWTEQDAELAQPPLVIITGGEPTMHPTLSALIDALHDSSYPVAIESNGTRYQECLEAVDWLVVSPKNGPEIRHKLPAQDPEPHPNVLAIAHEFRYVISGPNAPCPPYIENKNDPVHYLSPALIADGTGMEWQDPNYFPKFAPGAVERCMEIILADPRWRLSLQTHKWLRVR